MATTPTTPAPTLSIKQSVLDYCTQFFAWTGAERASCVIISKHHLCTYSHNRQWSIGQEVVVNLVDHRQMVAEVVRIDQRLDVIWLKTHDELVDTEPDTSLPATGKKYFLIGNSATQLQESPKAVRDGIICSDKITLCGHVLGRSGSAPGDSGSPVFAQSSGDLLGMTVGSELVPVQGIDQQKLSVSTPPRAYIVPINSLLLGIQ